MTAQEFDLAASAESASATARLCNLVITQALLDNARAIRIQAVTPERGGIEYERDGEWRKMMEVPMQSFEAVVAHFKRMAGFGPGSQPAQEGELRVRHEGASHLLDIRAEGGTTSVDRITITRR